MQNRIVVTRRCLEVTEGNGSGLPPGVEPRTISLDEWLAHVANDPVLVPVRLAANEDDALRAAHPVRLSDRSTDRWLYWAAGEIRANGPDPALLGAMLAIARALGARVRTDDDAYFRGSAHVFPDDGPRTATARPRAVAPRGDIAAARRPRREAVRVERVPSDPARAGRAVTGRTGPPDALDDERLRAERRSAQAMLVAGTITVVCAASVVWMMQA